MKSLTKAQSRKLFALHSCVLAASDKVFKTMPGPDICFMTCYAAAPMPIRVAHDRAVDNLHAFESAMLSEDRGHRNSLGHFQAYARGR